MAAGTGMDSKKLKLYMLMLGCKPPDRHTEQHDVFFGIGKSLNDLVPEIQAFWPQPGKIHIDAWREVSVVDGYDVEISMKNGGSEPDQGPKLFFIYLGGYQENKFEEQHYVVITVKEDKTAAYKEAKQTFFFKNNCFEDATTHIDDRYGVDVDDLYQIEEILSDAQKEKYRIALVPAVESTEDKINLGYFRLDALPE